MAQTVNDAPMHHDDNSKPSPSTTIGIVGGGIAGLYTALLLMREGYHQFHIFEGSGRVGGRVDTRFFSNDKDQYFEAGAMRIPCSIFHDITFDLIKCLNRNSDPERQIKLIQYIMSSSGNDLYINGQLRKGLKGTSDTMTPQSVGWDVPDGWKDKDLKGLMGSALNKFLEQLGKAAEEEKEGKPGAIDQLYQTFINNWDHLSFRTFLIHVMEYPAKVVDFMETVLTQSNQFALSVPATIMQNFDFNTKEWQTIDQGMSRLPQAMAALIGHNKITYGARVRRVDKVYEVREVPWEVPWEVGQVGQVEEVEEVEGGKKVKKVKVEKVEVTATGYNGVIKVRFDRVVIAIPPAALKMLVARPHWSAEKQMAIRSAHIVPLYKMGLRFKRRFWEQTDGKEDGSEPSIGGQSTTDLPIRWIVFPSYGIKGEKEGVLVVYAWMTDATSWLPLTPVERVTLAIDNLETVYKGRLGKDKNGKDETVANLLIETMDAVWAEKNSTGDAFGLPHQLSQHFAASCKPEYGEKIYFAGEHLSFHHTWISGAAESALRATRQLLKDSKIKRLAEKDEFKSELSSKFEVNFTPADPLFLLDSTGFPGDECGEYGGGDDVQLPRTLGNGAVHGVGPEVTHLRGAYGRI